MGYLVIAIGIALVIWGIMLLTNKEKLEKPLTTTEKPATTTEKTVTTSEKPHKEKVQSVDFDENKAKGDAFERFVVKNFDKKYFTLQEWRSDKYVEGIYAVSNHFPDLEVIFNLKSKGIRESFAIECKWRKSYYQESIEWAKDYQLKNYKDYAEKLKIPVFVVIGVGGEAEKPEELFIVPLQKMKSNIISKSELAHYKKHHTDARFFWDFDKNELQ